MHYGKDKQTLTQDPIANDVLQFNNDKRRHQHT